MRSKQLCIDSEPYVFWESYTWHSSAECGQMDQGVICLIDKNGSGSDISTVYEGINLLVDAWISK